jgi:hypothetical protein
MEYTLSNITYIAQPDDKTCWLAAYKMMLKYKGKPEVAAETLPNDTDMRQRGILDGEFLQCRTALGLCSSTYKGFLTVSDIEGKLKSYGPIWVSGKYCAGKYKHIVVVCGVRDTLLDGQQVYIADPWSGYVGARSAPRWIDLSTFKTNINQVPFSCQHWF